MSPIKRDYTLYLEDIIISIEKIISYKGDLNFNDFVLNALVVDAVIRNFEIIGEASNNIPNHIKEKYPEVPWKKMYGLRNLIAHEYFGIDHEMIWEIVNNNLPQNLDDLKVILNKESK